MAKVAKTKRLQFGIILKDLYRPNKKLRAAAKKVQRGINSHFKTDGWDLDYSMYKEDIFYGAFGHHLENYLLYEILNAGLVLTSRDGKLVIRRKNYGTKSKKKVSKARKRSLGTNARR